MRGASLLVVFAALGSGCSSSSTPAAATDSGAGEEQAASVDTWSSYGQGFFHTYCVECHSASDTTGRDFTQYAVVKSNAPTIRCGVCVTQDPSWACPATPVAKQFPIDDATRSNPKPTDAERNRIVAWIGAGAPQ